MTERPRSSRRTSPHRGRVLRTEWLSPHMVRVVLGGEGLADFSVRGFTDHYIKLLFPPTGVAHPQPFDPMAAGAAPSRRHRPVTRTYTVRHWDEPARELSVDFVHHGHDGVAGPWAARARPGDVLHFTGPGGGYAPAPDADWHLLAGDESALPAIAAALEAMPDDARGTAFVEVADAAEEVDIKTRAAVDLVWLHRGGARVGERLTAAVRAAEFAPGTVQAFVHGEAHFVKALRGHLLGERGLDRARASISGYWRGGADEDGWQATKHEWN
ncbi:MULTISPECIES: SIP domain-containing protein [unclassified Streptomyces]|uniref:siderophore-interacting protein n=1 Tax=unclassified Streptomyces TaxID=2593676 RepID=UPI0036EC0F4A